MNTHPIYKTLLIIGILVLLLSLYKLYEGYQEKSLATTLDNINGTLIYALSPTPERITNLYELNLKTGQEKEIIPNDSKNVKFSVTRSPDGRYFAYTSAPLDFNSKLLFPHTENLRIHIYDSLTGNIEETTTSTSTFRNKKPRWTSDGRYILYHGYSYDAWMKNESIRDPDNWTIYLYDTQTKITTDIGVGIEAEWLPDGKNFYYLRNDGLHLKNAFTLEDKLIKRVVSSSGTNPEPKTNSTMTLGVSPDGLLLAWATPLVHQFVLYKIDPVDSSSLTETKRFDTGEAEIFHPVFSPDSNFLAIQETEVHIPMLTAKATSTDQLYLPILDVSHPRITVYDLKTFRSKKVRDLSGFDFYGTSITQWVAK